MDENQALKILKDMGFEANDITSYIYCKSSSNGTRRVGIGGKGFTIRDLGKFTMFKSGKWDSTDEKEFRGYCSPSAKLDVYNE